MCALTRTEALQTAIREAEMFVRDHSKHFDASHDYHHIDRVRKCAEALAREEALPPDSILVCELAAILHDVSDWKYRKPGEPTGEEAVRAFLDSLAQTLDPADRDLVLEIVRRIGFKEELEVVSGAARAAPMPKELAIVQDADRLDAIGAIGIARCLTFGGAKLRVLYDPAVPPRGPDMTKEAYMDASQQATTINHFYEKLLRLSGMMKTEAGGRRAKHRHAFMEAYLEQFFAEWEGKA